MSAIHLFDAVSLWLDRASNTAPAPETPVDTAASDAATLDAVIRALFAQVPAEGTRTATGEELAEALMVPQAQRQVLTSAFLGAEVRADGSAHVRLSKKVRVTIGGNTLVLGPDLHAKIFADRFETTTGFAIKVGFVTPQVRSVARAEMGGQRGIQVQTTMGSRFLPFG